jgi:hypothetical protein
MRLIGSWPIIAPLFILESDIFGDAMTPLLLLFAAAVTSLPWVEDDYGKALADAKTRHVPLFVEVWAPW